MIATACSKDTAVVDRQETITDGASVAYKLSKGNYRLDYTATGDGVTAEWLGAANCLINKEAKVYSTNCSMPQDGQLVIKNPTRFGGGQPSIVALKVTKLAK